jgi:hypothetical protein
MWIVRLALRRPYTFVVVSILILIMGMLAHCWHPNRYFFDDRHLGYQHHLEL